ncbi:MAG: hypothetical protein K2K26_07950 [Muribaculaceae bacterium]|nr:hypothetical protein [Muribaculaceae bacterium]
MKRFPILLASLLTAAAPVLAQTEETVPNRILVTNELGSYTGYVLDRVNDIRFGYVEGEVAAKIDLDGFDLDVLDLSITRTEACEGFKITVIPGVIASQLTSDLQAIAYINRYTSDIYYQDFSGAQLTGIELNPDTEYAVMTVGIDRYGCECDVDKVFFHTDAPEIVGNPHVEAVIDETTLTSFTMTFTPNEDVTAYYCVAGEKGTLQSQYEMFAPMFGFTNFSQMIQQWGLEETAQATKTWTGMPPNTEYEVFVAMLDVNGNFAPYEVYEVSTTALGGPGEATVSITLGDYMLTEWWGEMKPSQFITFTPNDQASCFRVGVYRTEIYEESKEDILAELCSDPWMPTANWFFFETLTTDFQIDPQTSCVALAAAKNVNGEWGSVSELFFTTPDAVAEQAAAPAAPSQKIRARLIPTEKRQLGTVPTMRPRLTPVLK